MYEKSNWETFWEGMSWRMVIQAAIISPIIIFGIGLLFCTLG